MFRNASFLIVYASKLGHTRHIAVRLAEALERAGIESKVIEVGAADVCDPRDFTGVIAVGSVHRAHPSKPLIGWLSDHRASLEAVPLALVSVSLTAAGTDAASRDTVAGYSDALAAAAHVHPVLVEHVAGALQYTRYGPLTKLMMRRIAATRGLPTDPKADVELTDWTQLSRFADRLVALADSATDAPDHRRAHVEAA